MSERFRGSRIARVLAVTAVGAATFVGHSAYAAEPAAAARPCTFSQDDLNGNGTIEGSERTKKSDPCTLTVCLDLDPAAVDLNGDGFAGRDEQRVIDTPCSGGKLRGSNTQDPNTRVQRIQEANPQLPQTPKTEPSTTTTTAPTTTIYRRPSVPAQAGASARTPRTTTTREPKLSAAQKAARDAEAAGCTGRVQTEGWGESPDRNCADKLARVVVELSSGSRLSKALERAQASVAPSYVLNVHGNERCPGSVEEPLGDNAIESAGQIFVAQHVNGSAIISCGYAKG